MMCENCDGAGWQLWMWLRKPRFVPCIICEGKRTTIYCYGAQPLAPRQSDIVVRQGLPR